TADSKGAAECRGPAWRAWLPWICLSIFVFVWGIPKVKDRLNEPFGPRQNVHQLDLNQFVTPKFTIRTLDGHVTRVPPVVPPGVKPEEAKFTLNLVSATGTALLLAGVVAGFCLGQSPEKLLRLYWRTLLRVRISLLTIAVMLALG